ncbi:unnamed protein product, partial [Ectocarpus fasciculatus]
STRHRTAASSHPPPPPPSTRPPPSPSACWRAAAALHAPAGSRSSFFLCFRFERPRSGGGAPFAKAHEHPIVRLLFSVAGGSITRHSAIDDPGVSAPIPSPPIPPTGEHSAGLPVQYYLKQGCPSCSPIGSLARKIVFQDMYARPPRRCWNAPR